MADNAREKWTIVSECIAQNLLDGANLPDGVSSLETDNCMMDLENTDELRELFEGNLNRAVHGLTQKQNYKKCERKVQARCRNRDTPEEECNERILYQCGRWDIQLQRAFGGRNQQNFGSVGSAAGKMMYD